MATIRGWNFPEDLYYLIEKHVWVRPLPGGLARLGLTPAAYHLLNNSLTAISIQARSVGQLVSKGKSLAMVESLKYIGPLAAPLAGVFVRGNADLAADPDLAVADPYGVGWIAEMQPTDWFADQADLLTGPAAMAAYEKLLDANKIAWV
ncbi:MAG: glycine cleavage system protein H [Chloroflexi bacterium]|nr:glycine cleavage system protein H [Chloroflexota bacterium]